MGFIIGELSFVVLLPKVFFTVKKWNEENLKYQAEAYVQMI